MIFVACQHVLTRVCQVDLLFLLVLFLRYECLDHPSSIEKAKPFVPKGSHKFGQVGLTDRSRSKSPNAISILDSWPSLSSATSRSLAPTCLPTEFESSYSCSPEFSRSLHPKSRPLHEDVSFHGQNIIRHDKAKQDPLFAASDESTGLLNKLSESNKTSIFSSIVQIFNRQHPCSKTLSDELLDEFKTDFVTYIFDKAVLEPQFVNLYSQFCLQLSKIFPDFLPVLIRKCHVNFEIFFVQNSTISHEIPDQLEQGKRDLFVNHWSATEAQLDDERLFRENKLKAKVWDNVEFVASLILFSVVPPGVASAITRELVQDFQKPLAIEAFVTLWTKLLESAGINEYIETVVAEQITKFSTCKDIPVRERHLCSTWLDLFKEKQRGQSLSNSLSVVCPVVDRVSETLSDSAVRMSKQNKFNKNALAFSFDPKCSKLSDDGFICKRFQERSRPRSLEGKYELLDPWPSSFSATSHVPLAPTCLTTEKESFCSYSPEFFRSLPLKSCPLHENVSLLIQNIIRRDKAKQGPLLDVLKEVTGLLNKLSESNQTSIFRSTVQIFNRQAPCSKNFSHDLLADFKIEFINLLFDKAVMEPPFVDLYSQLCLKLSKEYPSLSKILFRTCQFHFGNYFLTDSSLSVKIDELIGKFKRDLFVNRWSATEAQLDDERLYSERKFKANVLGNLRFVASLILHSVVPLELSSEITNQLFENFQKPLAIEGLVTLWTKLLESAKINEYVEKVVAKQITQFSTCKEIPVRERCLCSNWLDLFKEKQRGQTRSRKGKKARLYTDEHAQKFVANIDKMGISDLVPEFYRLHLSEPNKITFVADVLFHFTNLNKPLLRVQFQSLMIELLNDKNGLRKHHFAAGFFKFCKDGKFDDLLEDFPKAGEFLAPILSNWLELGIVKREQLVDCFVSIDPFNLSGLVTPFVNYRRELEFDCEWLEKNVKVCSILATH
ncbi:hypothetical protein GEMRC1_000444 [Eukaryota sp. GEM-RC1]